MKEKGKRAFSVNQKRSEKGAAGEETENIFCKQTKEIQVRYLLQIKKIK
jgi:hypothetical protein